MNLPARTSTSLKEDRLAEIVRRLVAAVSPRAVYLFGSQLYGAPRRDSDIDIMVLVNDRPVGMELLQRGYACLRGLGLPVELHFCDTARFDAWGQVVGTLQREVHRKGRLLYAAEA
ncbi:MAG: nucleotidyltransferase domain-containing protein [Phycisphaerae bacterium]